MNFNRSSIPTCAIFLSGLVLWACDKDNAESQPEPATQQQPQQQEQQAQDTPAVGPKMMRQLRTSCPMLIEDAKVSVSDTDKGVALTFTTDSNSVADLRERAQHMAQMYEMHRGHGSMMWRHMGRGMGPHGERGMGHMRGSGPHGPMVAAKAGVTHVERGARIELEPTDASQLENLREHVRWHQQRMHSGECWMLGNQPGG